MEETMNNNQNEEIGNEQTMANDGQNVRMSSEEETISDGADNNSNITDGSSVDVNASEDQNETSEEKRDVNHYRITENEKNHRDAAIMKSATEENNMVRANDEEKTQVISPRASNYGHASMIPFSSARSSDDPSVEKEVTVSATAPKVDREVGQRMDIDDDEGSEEQMSESSNIMNSGTNGINADWDQNEEKHRANHGGETENENHHGSTASMKFALEENNATKANEEMRKEENGQTTLPHFAVDSAILSPSMRFKGSPRNAKEASASKAGPAGAPKVDAEEDEHMEVDEEGKDEMDESEDGDEEAVESPPQASRAKRQNEALHDISSARRAKRRKSSKDAEEEDMAGTSLERRAMEAQASLATPAAATTVFSKVFLDEQDVSAQQGQVQVVSSTDSDSFLHVFSRNTSGDMTSSVNNIQSSALDLNIIESNEQCEVTSDSQSSDKHQSGIHQRTDWSNGNDDKHFPVKQAQSCQQPKSSAHYQILNSMKRMLSVIFLCSLVYHTSSRISSKNKINVESSKNALKKSDVTLRQFLLHPDGFHLGMAPSFFGFYGYFGALITLEEEIGIIPTTLRPNNYTCDNAADSITVNACDDEENNNKLLSVAGASAGAMSAVLLSAGINPRVAADLATKFDFNSFADPFGWFALLKGQKFESIMKEFLTLHAASSKNVLLEESIIPVAVSSFDIRRGKSKILTHGCMAKAARASATFPLLFQPTQWMSEEDSDNYTSYLIDGGLIDPHGLLGLTKTITNKKTKARVLHLSIGEIYKSFQYPLDEQNIEAIASISIVNTPTCGPWAMENGKKAVNSARIAISKALDQPMYINKDGHYELRIDAAIDS